MRFGNFSAAFLQMIWCSEVLELSNEVRHSLQTSLSWGVRLAALCMGLMLVFPAWAYDVPLSEGSIRDAYYLGTRATTLVPDFLREYTQNLPELKVGRYTSVIRLETPFSQIAIASAKKLGYSAQDAVKEFLGRPLAFRISMDICYRIDAPEDAVRIKVFQNKREIFPESYDSSPYYPATDKHTRATSIGEKVELEFKPDKIESSTMLIVIDTPDGQHAEATFDLQTFR